MLLEAELVIKIRVQCGKALEVKAGIDGYLRVIPIVGGTFEGKIKGHVISGGADWNTEKQDGISHVVAKYVIQTEDGEYIGVENVGIIHWDDQRKIKTVPKFSTCKEGKYAWLNSGVYVGALEVLKEDLVEITVYQMM
ncbi:MAG: DUF3237 domain-containing protein [Cellulosilyticum sp.]|nr:DUF3237 domain-containing protein [Cellulosilyticum sp.]